MSFLAVIPHIRVQGANLQTSGILLGGVPLVASTMFAHALARKLGVKDTGVIYIHHDRQDLGEILKDNYNRIFFHPAQRRGSAFINKNDYSSKNPNALSLQPTASCHLHLSLVIRFDGRRRPRLADLQNLLINSRFAGGQIISVGEVEWADDNEKTLKDVLGNTLKTGFVVLDRHDVLLAYQQSQNLNRLQAFTRLLALTKDGLNYAFGEHHGLSFLSATNLGYALLEDPKTDRTGVRQAYDLDGNVMVTSHAYAEPLIGLVQYVSIRQLLNFVKVQSSDDVDLSEKAQKPHQPQNPIAEPLCQLSDQPQGLFWQYQWQTHDGGDVFLLQQSI